MKTSSTYCIRSIFTVRNSNEFFVFSNYAKLLTYSVFQSLFCRRGNKYFDTLMSIFEGLSPYIFRRMMKKTRFLREKMDGKLFNPHHSRHFSFVNKMIEVFSPTFQFGVACKQLCFLPRKGYE